jgi:YVTN family beta-propeller protein
MSRHRRFVSALAVAAITLAACSTAGGVKRAQRPSSTAPSTTVPASPSTRAPARVATGPVDIYAADRPNALSDVVKRDPPRVYVPNSLSNTVDVIDPTTNGIVDHFAVGVLPQHVVPAWDMKTLYVTNDRSNTLTPIDPMTGRPGPTIPVEDPYNMYFTPDGKYAIVVAERLARLDFRDPHTFELIRSVPVDCVGVDHIDFSADGRYLIASCEFSGQILKLDVPGQKVIGTVALNGGKAKPQDVKLDPTGHVFYVADMIRGGVYTVDGATFTVTGFIPTGAGAHGLYVSRDSRLLYVTNRDAGTVSLIDFATNAVTRTWVIPGGGSPDMGGVSADGKVLWVSGRYNGVVYAIDTASGAVLQKIRVGSAPHGLCVFPQPGRYSLGHTGVFR